VLAKIDPWSAGSSFFVYLKRGTEGNCGSVSAKAHVKKSPCLTHVINAVLKSEHVIATDSRLPVPESITLSGPFLVCTVESIDRATLLSDGDSGRDMTFATAMSRRLVLMGAVLPVDFEWSDLTGGRSSDWSDGTGPAGDGDNNCGEDESLIGDPRRGEVAVTFVAKRDSLLVASVFRSIRTLDGRIQQKNRRRTDEQVITTWLPND
jgi:hypothetical protein